jgi:hypothetical protein
MPLLPKKRPVIQLTSPRSLGYALPREHKRLQPVLAGRRPSYWTAAGPSYYFGLGGGYGYGPRVSEMPKVVHIKNPTAPFAVGFCFVSSQ